MSINTNISVTIEVHDDMSWRLLWAQSETCPVCDHYLSRRAHTISLAIASPRSGQA